MLKITKNPLGGGRLSSLFNKDVKELNGIILSLFCVSFLLIVGLVSYKVNSSYAIFTDTIKGEATIEISVNPNLDSCNPNKPVLSDNMIPVYYDEKNDVWRKADSENKNPKYKWYDYCDKMWANSVTVTNVNRRTYLSADLGTEIPMEDILTMQVWIPRYKYTVWNYNSDGTVTSEPQEIQIEFENGTTTTGEIECTDLANMGTSDGTKNGIEPTTSETCNLKSTGATCTNRTCNNKKYTHPAFTFGDKELTGFWVGKFEVSSDINCTPITSCAIGEGCNINTIKPLVKPNVLSWRGAMVSVFENNMMAMNDSGNKYGFASTDDTHMIKNMEWGAAAYLSHSRYGINGEIAINSYDGYMTGCGPQTSGSTSSGLTCNVYNTSLGQSSSTTGNIYGVYDMSGGVHEIVMGNIVSPDGKTMMSGYRATGTDANHYSGYTGIVYYETSNGDYKSITGTYSYPNGKYYDKYSFGTGNAQRNRSKLGDGLKELLNISSLGWYSDSSGITYSVNPWLLRGGSYSNDSAAGVFGVYYGTGYAGVYGSRLVISQ